MKVGDLVKRAHSMNKSIGIIVKNTPEYSITQYHVLMEGCIQYFSARHIEVIDATSR